MGEWSADSLDSQRVPFLVKASLLLIFAFLDLFLSSTVDFGNVPLEPSFLRFVFLAFVEAQSGALDEDCMGRPYVPVVRAVCAVFSSCFRLQMRSSCSSCSAARTSSK